MRVLLLLYAALVVAEVASAELSDEARRARAEEALRIAPQDLPGLPGPIRKDLESRGCKIPQAYVGPKPHNAIQGAFRRPGQVDWAVVCSKDQTSAILIYWAGSIDQVEELEGGRAESVHVETLDNGELLVGFHRKISAVGKSYILDHYDTYREGPKPPPIDHEGINDAYVEKASTVLYWYEGRWLRLAGAD